MDLPDEIKNAIITVGGDLAPNFKYITSLREQNEKLKKLKDEFEEEAKQGSK